MMTPKWICSECGQENEENFCINCGTTRNILVEPSTWICPKCGKKNSDMFCEDCGTHKPEAATNNLVEESSPLLTSTNISTTSENNDWVCPKCGKKNSDMFCEDCGTHKPEVTTNNLVEESSPSLTSTNSSTTSENNDWICPKCGKKNSDMFCEDCGTHKPELIEKRDEPNKTPISYKINARETLLTGAPKNNSIPKNEPPITSRKRVVPGIELESTSKSNSTKIFLAGCVFAAIIVATIFGISHLQLFQETVVEMPISANNSMSEKDEQVVEEKQIPDKESSAKPEENNNSGLDSAMSPSSYPNPQNNDPLPKADDSANTTNTSNKNDQQMAIEALYAFHKNITDHKLQDAYAIFSEEMQDKISYEGWVPGFSTTVSSTPSDVKVLSETDANIVLTYHLQAVDNPGGIQNFEGTAVMVKVDNAWKINDVVNKVK